MFGLAGNIAVVTGGSNGIGEAIVYALSIAGAQVIAADIDVDNGRRICAHLRSNGYAAEVVRTDVTDSQSVGDLITYVEEKYSAIDILVNNAGGLRDADITAISDQDWAASLAVNLTGVFYCCRAALPHMTKAKRGKIINVAATDARQAYPFAGVDYCAANGGVMALTRQLALQVSPYGITVNAVAPGVTDTAMQRRRSEADRKYMMGKIPMGRMGRPEEIAGAVLYLASSGGDYILGETLDVNGGLYLG
jgi:NAD(P)-dependent dehydrogenase (short-subunit alcohol dehydrogenase family)